MGTAHRSAAIACGARPVPFRTRKLSRIAPRVLRGQPVGGQGAADRWTAPDLVRPGAAGIPAAPFLFEEVEILAHYTMFVIGNIASGKSSACRYLAALGGRYIDLDELAKNLYVPGSQLVDDIAREFGIEVLSETEGIDRSALARLAFATPENAELLNAIVHPYVREALDRLLEPCCCMPVTEKYPFTVIEVSVPAAVKDSFSLADDIVAISVSLDVRRARALGRGMSLFDFERRAGSQPSDDEILSMATVVIDNSGSQDELERRLRELLLSRGVSVEA